MRDRIRAVRLRPALGRLLRKSDRLPFDYVACGRRRAVAAVLADRFPPHQIFIVIFYGGEQNLLTVL